MRRAIQHGTAWHPIRPTMPGFVDTMLPAFVEMADHLEMPVLLLDTYHDYLVDELRDPRPAWDMFEAVATKVFDLDEETSR